MALPRVVRQVGSGIGLLNPNSRLIWNRDFMVQGVVRERIQNEFRLRGDYLGLHFRNTDRKNDIREFGARIERASRKYRIRRLLIASDDHTAKQQFEFLFPNLEIHQLSTPGDFGGRNIHYHSDDRDAQIFECLMDIFALLNCSVFLPSMNSGLSKWVIKMATDRKNIFGTKSRIRTIVKQGE